MASGDVVLQFGLEAGRNANAIVAAEALIDWVRLAREAARAIDPIADLTVELIGRDEGSLKNLLRLVDQAARDVAEGAGEYPHLKKTAVALAGATFLAGVQSAVQVELQPAVQTVQLSEADRTLLKGMRERVDADKGVETASKRFFKTVSRDPAVTNVQIAGGFKEPPMVVIPRSEFPERSGLWAPEELPAPEQTQHAVWDVVLLKASFTHNPTSWTFSRDGLSFAARMEDPTFLAGIAARTVPITLQEGVRMQVEVEYRERLVGQVWEYVDRTRKVIRVITPRPLAAPLTLPVTSPPKKP